MGAMVGNQRINWGRLYRYYKQYSTSPELIREKAGNVIVLGREKLAESKINTCAVRVAYAIHRTGVRLPYVKGRSWKYVGKYASPAWLPSLAADYKWILRGETLVKKNMKLTLSGKRGIVLFYVPPSKRGEDGFGASGHITLFHGLDFLDGGDYWSRPEVSHRYVWWL